MDAVAHPRTPAGAPDVHVATDAVSKRYGAIRALSEVTVEVARGSVHALVGENGAGKSTLGKTIAGLVRPDGGTLVVDGRPVAYGSPRKALGDGITAIAQELSLLPDRSVMENVFLGREPRRAGFLDRRALRRDYAALVERTGFALPGEQIVRGLRLAERQKVEILRALARDARLIVMDEPTAALGRDDAEQLLADIRALSAQGTTVVYVSHFLEEVLAVADAISVLKDGRLVHTVPAAGQTPATLVEAMLGRTLDTVFPPKAPVRDAPVVLEARGLTRAGVVEDVSLTLRAGEIVGLAGLVGSGRSELARMLFGADPVDAGTVAVDGERVTLRRPRDAIAAGIALLPEDRKQLGLVLGRRALDNVTLPHLAGLTRGGFVRPGAEARRGADVLARVGAPAAAAKRVGGLSGGNQQKVLFAKWLVQSPRLFVADQPTRGIDMGAREAIYRLLASLAAEGMAVLVISDDVEEVLGLAHRVLVMRGGRIAAELDGARATEGQVIAAALGVPPTNGTGA